MDTLCDVTKGQIFQRMNLVWFTKATVTEKDSNLELQQPTENFSLPILH